MAKDKIKKKSKQAVGKETKPPEIKDPQEQAKKQQDFDAAISGSALGGDKISIPEDKEKKRHRRTRAEIEAERFSLRDDGFDMIAQFFKSLSDNDVKRYGLDPVEVDFFYPVAQNYAKIINYYMPRAKEIYFVMMMAVFQSYTILSIRADMIRAKLPKAQESQQRKQDEPQKKDQSGLGFPSTHDVSKQKV